MNPYAPQGLYRYLPNLYPRGFRDEYGEKIQKVFDLTLEGKQGWSALRLVWRELVSAPFVLLKLHWRDWRGRDLKSPLRRLAALAGGLALATLPALLDRAARSGYMRPGEAAPILGLWVIATALMLIPPLALGTAIRFKQLVKEDK